MDKAAQLIEIAWDNGYTGPLGPRPKSYELFVESDTVIFSKLDTDEEEMFHLCLHCILLDRDFVAAVCNGEYEPQLKEMVLMDQKMRVNFLYDQHSSYNKLAS